jgi:hypothetical protein
MFPVRQQPARRLIRPFSAATIIAIPYPAANDLSWQVFCADNNKMGSGKPTSVPNERNAPEIALPMLAAADLRSTFQTFFVCTVRHEATLHPQFLADFGRRPAEIETTLTRRARHFYINWRSTPIADLTRR